MLFLCWDIFLWLLMFLIPCVCLSVLGRSASLSDLGKVVSSGRPPGGPGPHSLWPPDLQALVLPLCGPLVPFCYGGATPVVAPVGWADLWPSWARLCLLRWLWSHWRARLAFYVIGWCLRRMGLLLVGGAGSLKCCLHGPSVPRASPGPLMGR